MRTAMIILGVLIVAALAVGLKGRSQTSSSASTSPVASASVETSPLASSLDASASPVVSVSPITDSNTSSASSQADAVVTISETGFTPKAVTIKQGQTIQFKNNGSGPHYVASDPHPTHTDYTGLQSKDLLPNQSWSFAFAKIGTWGIHDHENPSMKMTVTVKS